MALGTMCLALEPQCSCIISCTEKEDLIELIVQCFLISIINVLCFSDDMLMNTQRGKNPQK